MITSEIVELRNENSKYFLHQDGTYTVAMYSKPIHFLQNGEWKDINASLKLNNNETDKYGKAMYTPEAMGLDISFPQDLKENQKISISKNNCEIELEVKKGDSDLKDVADKEMIKEKNKLESECIVNNAIADNSTSANVDVSLENNMIMIDNEEKMELDNLSSSIMYKSVLPNTDFEYIINSDKIKENIIINSPQTEYTYEFKVSLTGLSPEQQADGSIFLFDKNNKSDPVFVIESPFMVDSNMSISTSVTMELKDNILTVVADSDWINDSNRKFPVKIDPTITAYVSTINDVYVSSLFNTTNFNSDSINLLGTYVAGITRDYYKFSLPKLPDDSVVTNANFYVKQLSCDTNNASQIYAFDLTGLNSWTYSGVTWDNQPVPNEENGALIEGIKIIDYCETSSSSDFIYKFNLTKTVKNWYENNNNNGIMLTTNDESKASNYKLYPAETEVYSNKPSLTIDYCYNVGIEDYWPYETIDLGRSGVEYVNTYNGSLTYISDDINMTGNILPININHVYNNNLDYQIYENCYSGMKVGSRFHLNIQKILIPIETSDPLYAFSYRYKLYDGDGTLHYFIENENMITEEYNEDLILTTEGSNFIICDSLGNKEYYNSSGQLFEVKDVNNNYQTINIVNNKIMSVTDSFGRVVTFGYNESGWLISMMDPAGRSISFSYITQRNYVLLSGITYPDGKQTLYNYLSLLLSKVTAIDGSFTNITYISTNGCGKRIASIYYYDKNSSEIDHYAFQYTQENESGIATGNTLVTSNNEKSNRYLFDQYGRVRNITNQDGQTQYMVYNNFSEEDRSSFNSLVDNSELQTISNNLLKSHGFEGSGWRAVKSSENCLCGLTEEDSSNGKQSFKVELNDLTDNVKVTQPLSATASNIYTISVDINIPEDMELAEEGGVTFGLQYSYNGQLVFDHGEWLGSKKTDGWERFSYTIHMPDASSRSCTVVLKMANAKGVVYFDNVQIEKSGGSRYYNLVENSDFFNSYRATTEPTGVIPYGWSTSGLDSGDGAQVRGDRKFFMMTGSCNKAKIVYQSVPVNAEAGETLIIGGRAAAYATTDDANRNKFCIQAVLYSTEDDPNPEAIEINFDRSINMEHQVAATYYTLNKKCDHLIFRFLYYYHVDCATLDDAFVYVGSFGEHYDYDDGKLTSVSNDESKKVKYEYYDSGDIKSVSQSYGYDFDTESTDSQSTDISAVSEENDSIYYEYDDNHNVTEASNKNGKKVEYEYLNGQVITQTTIEETENGETPKAITQRYTYIQNGNYVKTYTDENGNVTTYTYDNNDQPLRGLVVRIDYPNGNYVNYTYDENTDELVSASSNIDSANSAAVNIMYTDYLPVTILKNGMNYSYEFDSQNRVTASKIGQIGRVTYSYDNCNRLAQQTFANGSSYTPIYDSRGRLAEDIWDGNSIAQYYYNENDRLSQVIDEVTGVNYRYDYAFYGLPHRIVGSDGTKTLYDYDLSGNISKVDFYIGNDNIYSARFYPNSSGNIEDTVLPSFNNTMLHYNYDGFDRLVGNSFGPFSREFSYYETENASSYLISNYTNRMPMINTYQSFNYTYDSNGNVFSIVEENRDIEAEGDYDTVQSISSTFYSYDGIERLKTEETDGNRIEYSYDNSGNLTLVKENGIILHNYSYSDPLWTDLLTSVDGKAITYDQNGNPLTYDGHTFSWQYGTRLASILGDDIDETYTYDALGHRVSKVTKNFGTSEYVTTQFIYSGDLLVRQVTGNNVMDFQYDYNNDVIGFNYNGTQYFYIKNMFGDVVYVMDSDGNIAAEYRYDAYGNVRYSHGELKDINPIRYRSYYQDNSTGYYYLNTRYYNPEWRRFISADSVFITGNMYTGANMYAYCNDNPVSFVDSQGTEATVAEYLLGHAVRLTSKVISRRLTKETNTFFFIANNAALPAVKTIFGPDFATSKTMHLAQPFLELFCNSLPDIYSGTWTFDAPTGLRHFMPVNMSQGAPWAAYFLGFEESTYCDENNYFVKAANSVLNTPLVRMFPALAAPYKALIKYYTFTNYTTVEGKYMWQSQVGYSGFYDLAFSLGGPIKRLMYKFETTVNGVPRYYVIWCWKADYWNLGAGAEIGIYYTDSLSDAENNFYLIDENLTLHVEMDIDYGLNDDLLSVGLNEFHQTNWWVTSFTPSVQFPNIDLIHVNLKVRFTNYEVGSFNNYKLMKPFYQEWLMHQNVADDAPDVEKDWSKIEMLGYAYRSNLQGHSCPRCSSSSLHPSLCTCVCSLHKASNTYPDCREYSCKEYTDKCTAEDNGCLHHNDPDNGFQFKITY